MDFRLAAARFTGAPLIVASASAADGGLDLVQQDEDVVVDVSDGLEEARRELKPKGIPAECAVPGDRPVARGVEASLDALMEASPGAGTAG